MERVFKRRSRQSEGREKDIWVQKIASDCVSTQPARGTRQTTTHAAAMSPSLPLLLKRCLDLHILTSAHAAIESAAVHTNADVVEFNGSTVENSDSKSGDCQGRSTRVIADRRPDTPAETVLQNMGPRHVGIGIRLLVLG